MAGPGRRRTVALAVAVATALLALVPAASARVVFLGLSKGASGEYNVWRMDNDGGDLENVVPGLVSGLAQAPTGDRIVYSRPFGDLYSNNLDGTDEKVVRRRGTGLVFENARYSADGGTLVGQYGQGIGCMPAAGGDPRSLLAWPAVEMYAPTFSSRGKLAFLATGKPDGTSFGFFPTDPSQPSGSQQQSLELFVADGDGGNVKQITSRADYLTAYEPSFSPDGSQIIFSAIRASDRAELLFVYTTEGQLVKTFAAAGAEFPEWEPKADSALVNQGGLARLPFNQPVFQRFAPDLTWVKFIRHPQAHTAASPAQGCAAPAGNPPGTGGNPPSTSSGGSTGGSSTGSTGRPAPGKVAPRRVTSQVLGVRESRRSYLRAGRLYEPILYVDHEDGFWPVSFGNVLGLEWDKRFTCLVGGKRKRCGSKGRPLPLRFLRPGRGGGHDYLDYPAGRGDIHDQQESFHQHVARRPGRTVRSYFFPGYGRKPDTIASFQYWLFYNFNYIPTSIVGRGYHEGDFEEVAILFRQSRGRGRTIRKTPKYVFFSQHTGGDRLHWNDEDLQRKDTHPIAYAARGSHANYRDCGRHLRGVLPDDISECDGKDRYRFAGVPLIELRPPTWACWGGRLGRGGSLPRYGGAPRAPLRQQGYFDRTPPDLCRFRSPVASMAQSADDANQDVRSLFDDCADWVQPPTRSGSKLVACDQGVLDRYFDSGLSDPGPERLRILAPGRRGDPEPPSVFSSHDPIGLRRASITADERVDPQVYAASMNASGDLLEATFANVPVQAGDSVRLQQDALQWRLVNRAGATVARASPHQTLAPRRPSQPASVGVRVRRSRAVITWQGQGDLKGVRFGVALARTRRGLHALTAVKRIVAAKGSGPYRVRIRVRRARFLAIVAERAGRTTYSGAVRVRARR